MKRSLRSLSTAGLLIFALLSSCAPTPPSPSGEVSPPSVAESTTTPAAVATPTPAPAKPTTTPAAVETPTPTAVETPAPSVEAATPPPAPAEIPLTDYAKSSAVPDFLTTEQQTLYRQAQSLYGGMFGGITLWIDSGVFRGSEPGPYRDPVELDGYIYTIASGVYQNWADFDAAIHSVFTDRFWVSRNTLFDGIPIYREIDGRLGVLELERGAGYCYNENFPDEFRLDKQTEEEISFTLIGHYSWVFPNEGETYEERNARRAREYEWTWDFPIRMVLTEDGWRFDKFYTALADEDGPPWGRIIEGDKVAYVDERLGFAMEFPESWRGKLEAEPEYDLDHRDGGHCITFYHKPTRESCSGGVLFHIDCYPGIWTEDDPPVVAGSSTIVLQTDRYTFFFRTPSDVQWHERDEELELDYKAFMADFEYVQAHITPIN